MTTIYAVFICMVINGQKSCMQTFTFPSKELCEKAAQDATAADADGAEPDGKIEAVCMQKTVPAVPAIPPDWQPAR